MSKPATRHRDGMEGHTECGIPLTKPGLDFQPADGSGEPPTCRRCIRLITHRCYKCREDVQCYRAEFTDTMDRVVHLAFYCPRCGGRADWGHYPGKRAADRRKRERQKSNREFREQNAQRKTLELKDALNGARHGWPKSGWTWIRAPSAVSPFMTTS